MIRSSLLLLQLTAKTKQQLPRIRGTMLSPLFFPPSRHNYLKLLVIELTKIIVYYNERGPIAKWLGSHWPEIQEGKIRITKIHYLSTRLNLFASSLDLLCYINNGQGHRAHSPYILRKLSVANVYNKVFNLVESTVYLGFRRDLGVKISLCRRIWFIV